MRVSIVGGGPAGLYLALLLKRNRADSEVTVFERNPADATYGWGVVFSDRTLTSFREADFKTYDRITDHFIIWDAIDVRYRDRVIRCSGQGFSGIARKTLLRLLRERCAELGVELHFETEVTDPEALQGSDLLVAADGIRSVIRERNADVYKPRYEQGGSRYIWFGTSRVFDSFTFAFRENEHGFFQAHAYPFDGSMSTFIVECDESTWRRAQLDVADDEASISYCESLFDEDLQGHSLRSNDSRWINFVTMRNKTWHHGNVVLVGDAAHTAHFSIGSGTKLAMEDSIALANALEAQPDVESALIEYELERMPRVERLQEAARQSQEYFENTAIYRHMEPEQFTFHLLTRSGRINYGDLRVRDEHLVAAVDRWFAARAQPEKKEVVLAAPPAFAPMKLRDLELSNRVAVGAAPTYSATDGVPQPGVLAEAVQGGVALVLTEVVAVSAHGRITPGDAGLYEDSHEAAWKSEIGSIEASEVNVGVTLGHSGPRGSTKARRNAVDIALPEQDGWAQLAASKQRYGPRSAPAAEIDSARMVDVRDDFVSATRRAEAAGFRMVEIHMGHGYLLGTFLSPLTNRRQDGYGGLLPARLRFPLEVLEAVRREWPEELPVGVVLNATDWARGGLSLKESVTIAQALKAHGCDIIRVVAGQTTARFFPRYDPYFLAHYADRIRNQARVATIATGDISTLDRVNTIVAGGRADLCLLQVTARRA